MMSASMTFKRRRSGSRWGVAGSVIRHARQHDALADDRIVPEVSAVLVPRDGRSEEHTSELQSLMRIPYAVFCLTKKNNQARRVIPVYNKHPAIMHIHRPNKQ